MWPMQRRKKIVNAKLPDAFKDLEYLVGEWAIEDGHERYLKRVNSTMDEMKVFYNAMAPRGKDAIDYLDQYDYQQALPDDAENLRNLLFTLITVSLAVELWRQPRVKNSAKTILTRLC